MRKSNPCRKNFFTPDHPALRTTNVTAASNGANAPSITAGVINAVKYYPIGHSGVCTDSRARRFGTVLNSVEHPKYFNDNTIITVVIEKKSAVDELDDILANPEVDIVSVSDADLSYDFGRPGETMHPLQIELRNDICKKILTAHKTVLDKVTTPDDIKRAYNEGKRCFYITSDE